MTTLVVWRDDRRVGVLDTTTNGEVRFTYDADVVAEGDRRFAVGVRCPVRGKPYVGPDAEAVFENLLPEGNLRRTLGQATKHDVGDTVGLLGVVAGDCAGALHLWPKGTQPPTNAAYDVCAPAAMADAFAGATSQLRLAVGRAALSGAQPKLALLRMPPLGGSAPEYRLPRNGAPTTVIVKRADSSFPGLLEAELVGMRLMHAAGVPTASSSRCATARDCHESARFDREVREDGTVGRLHAEDGCQVTGRPSRAKYARMGAPTFQDLVAVLQRWSADPLADRESLFRWAVANAAMGNYDGHAKNVSFVYVAPDQVRLAPAYDVVVTAVNEHLDRTFALSFGGTTLPQALDQTSLAAAAREFRLSRDRATELAADVVTRVGNALPHAVDEVLADGGEQQMLDRCERAVRRAARELSRRLGL
ncbi:MAG: HipA domain-containing protein [Gemmatimonadaceae bacterium]|nr:HipA domain-containing protein [Gemmatimonadaceae bacterium]